MTRTGIKSPVGHLLVTLVASSLMVFVLCLPLLNPAFTYPAVPMIAAVLTGAATPLILDPHISRSLWIIGPGAFLFFCVLIALWIYVADITFGQNPRLGEMLIAVFLSWLLILVALALGITIARTVLQKGQDSP